MMLVGFASTEGGCAYYRGQLPARYLAAQGLGVAVGVDLAVAPGEPIGLTTRDLDPETDQLIADDERDALVGAIMFDDGWLEPDVLILAGGYPAKIGAELIAGAVATGQRVVCDCDDWPWLPVSNPHYFEGCGERKIDALRAASAVTCSTPALRKMLTKHGVDAVLARNWIDRERWRDERLTNIVRRNTRSGSGPLRVGYRGLLAGFHDSDVAQLGRLPPAEYVHIGAHADSRSTFASITGARRVEEVDAVRFEGYGPQLCPIDVAVIPYAPRPFSSSKSNIAAMEWTAAGVPWLAQGNEEVYRLDPLHGWCQWSQLDRWFADLADPDARAAVVGAQWDSLGSWLDDEASPAAWLDALAAVGCSTPAQARP